MLAPRLCIPLAQRRLAHGKVHLGCESDGGRVRRVELGDDMHQEVLRQAEEVACRGLLETLRLCEPLGRLRRHLITQRLCLDAACSGLQVGVRNAGAVDQLLRVVLRSSPSAWSSSVFVERLISTMAARSSAADILKRRG